MFLKRPAKLIKYVVRGYAVDKYMAILDYTDYNEITPIIEDMISLIID